jgi:RND family efflux transporter MFP subunit
MQPPDPSFPDDISRSEPDRVATTFAPDTGRRVKLAVGIAALVLLAGFVLVRVLRFLDDHAIARASAAAVAAPPLVDVVLARTAATDQDLVLPGETAAWFDSTLYARVSGFVARWSADIGDHVKKGQVLATLETPELDAELAAARAQLQASESQVVARRAEAEFGKTTYERWRDSPQGVVSEQERDSKKADADSALARLYSANAQVELDRAHVVQYAALAQFKQVKAPYDGTITERKIDVGNLVTAGSSSTTTPLYRMNQTDPLRVFVDVPQADASELMQAGVPAEIRARDATGTVVSGKITRSAQAIERQARTMRVEVDIPNQDQALVPGMYVTVAFRLQAKGSVEVPAAALLFRAGGAEVVRVGADDKAEFLPVSIVRDNGPVVEIGGPVRAGDRLVSNISSQISPHELLSVAGGADTVTRTTGTQ